MQYIKLKHEYKVDWCVAATWASDFVSHFQLIMNSTLLCGMVMRVVFCILYCLKVMAWHSSVAFRHHFLNFVLNCALHFVLRFAFHTFSQKCGLVLYCVVRGVARHLDRRQNPNELRLLTNTNGKVQKAWIGLKRNQSSGHAAAHIQLTISIRNLLKGDGAFKAPSEIKK